MAKKNFPSPFVKRECEKNPPQLSFGRASLFGDFGGRESSQGSCRESSGVSRCVTADYELFRHKKGEVSPFGKNKHQNYFFCELFIQLQKSSTMKKFLLVLDLFFLTRKIYKPKKIWDLKMKDPSWSIKLMVKPCLFILGVLTPQDPHFNASCRPSSWWHKNKEIQVDAFSHFPSPPFSFAPISHSLSSTFYFTH